VFLLEQDGKKDNVKIVDFGIAKATSEAPVVRKRNSQENIHQVTEQKISSQTMPGTLMGTPAYLAPEMALGHEVDFRVDQYALGVILYEMVTGELPFEASTIGQMLQHHISTKPPALSKRCKGSTPSLDALVARLLSKSPEERFPTMRSVGEALEHEVELRLLARGDTALPAHIAEALSKTQAGTHLRVAGRKVPMWALLPLLLVFLVGGGAARACCCCVSVPTRSRSLPRSWRSCDSERWKWSKSMPRATTRRCGPKRQWRWPRRAIRACGQCSKRCSGMRRWWCGCGRRWRWGRSGIGSRPRCSRRHCRPRRRFDWQRRWRWLSSATKKATKFWSIR
jgi:hypothetical protein